MQGGAHAGTAGVAYTVDVSYSYFCVAEGGFYDGDEPLPVVFGGIFGEKAGAGGGGVGVADVGEGDGGAAFGGVED